MPQDQDASGRDHGDALVRVRKRLHELGCSDREIDRAIADDVVDLLMVDRMVLPTERQLTQADLVERTDLPLDEARRFWRALGFLDVGDEDRVFTDMDLEAVRLFQSMVAVGLVDTETAVQMARVIGSSMARIAEAEAGPGSTPLVTASGDSVIDADEFASRAGASLPAMARLLEYVWRRHLQAATHRAMLHRTRRHGEGSSPVMAVGFADMVGFTLLSQHLRDEELATVVSRFEALAHDTVVALGGRVVKMIGDEVMFVVPTAIGAASIGLGLAEAYAGDELLSDVRVGLSFGPVLVHDGDFYGPVVNLASRLVGVANPGTVLVSDDFRRQLSDEERDEGDLRANRSPDGIAADGHPLHDDGAVGGAFSLRPLHARTLKDIGRVQAWRLTRAGAAHGPERGRSVRWERLEGVLRELDGLRERGELARSRRTSPPGESGEMIADSDPPPGR